MELLPLIRIYISLSKKYLQNLSYNCLQAEFADTNLLTYSFLDAGFVLSTINFTLVGIARVAAGNSNGGQANRTSLFSS
jgi:hypothetical protein